MVHGELNINNLFTIPNNVYLIQSNTCGISNYEKPHSLIKNKSFDELIRLFESSTQYTIIKPNTEICDIRLSGQKYDLSLWGIFDFKSGTTHYKSVIENKTDDMIKSRMESFF